MSPPSRARFYGTTDNLEKRRLKTESSCFHRDYAGQAPGGDDASSDSSVFCLGSVCVDCCLRRKPGKRAGTTSGRVAAEDGQGRDRSVEQDWRAERSGCDREGRTNHLSACLRKCPARSRDTGETRDAL